MITFTQYMQDVDEALQDYCGLCHRDLPDQCYYDYYEDGVSPEDIIDDMIEAGDLW